MSYDIILVGNSAFTSPYVMSAYVALEEKGLKFKLELLDLDRSEQHAEEYVRRSVTNRVPSLFCDGFWLSESSAITEYLEERFAGPEYARLYPEGLVERARVRMVQASVRSDFGPIREERSTDTVFQAAPAKPLSPEALATKARIERIALSLIDPSSGYVAHCFSIADVDLSMLLQRLVANGDPIDPRLVDYANRIWQRPSIRKWLAQTSFKSR